MASNVKKKSKSSPNVKKGVSNVDVGALTEGINALIVAIIKIKDAFSGQGNRDSKKNRDINEH